MIDSIFVFLTVCLTLKLGTLNTVEFLTLKKILNCFFCRKLKHMLRLFEINQVKNNRVVRLPQGSTIIKWKFIYVLYVHAGVNGLTTISSSVLKNELDRRGVRDSNMEDQDGGAHPVQVRKMLGTSSTGQDHVRNIKSRSGSC